MDIGRASAIAWALAAAWEVPVLRRIRREERHLVDHLGAAYETYAARTPRVIPIRFTR